MNAQDIFDGVTDIRSDLIHGAKGPFKKQKPKKRWLGVVAAMLAVVILGNVFLRPGGGLTVYTIAQAEYPQMAAYPYALDQFPETAFGALGGDWWNTWRNARWDAWREDVQAQRRELGDISSLQSFFARSAQAFLAGEEGRDRVYSPLNVYMSLAMLAQLTGGESREQILTLLGSDSMDALRQQAGDVWNSNYRDDGVLTSILASSLWLGQNVNFDQDTMDTLARDFYTSSYWGKMGSEELDKALQDWLSEQTGGLLEKQARNMELDSETILALASTVYFKAKWGNEFSKEDTKPGIFRAPDKDVETDFMHQRDDQPYYWGDRFSAVSQYFKEGGAMWFILPDEGIAPEELLADAEAMDFLFTADKYEWEDQKFLFVNKSIPKFDVSSQFELKEGLQALGITDVFDPAVSDFTPMTTDVEDPIILSQAAHAARVVIDEEGCTAAALTVLDSVGAGLPPDEEVDFVLDRPFLFCVSGISGLPLFVGIVDRPAGK